MVFANIPKQANMKQIKSIFAEICLEANKKKLRMRRTLIPYGVEKKNQHFFLIYINTKQDIHTFMSFGVLGEYTKSLFVSSPCKHRFFPRILRTRLNTFWVFGDDFVYR
jgi:hypothetical protein